MNTAYRLVANAIYTEQKWFADTPKIVYKGSTILLNLEPSRILDHFITRRFSLSDIKNILYIYSSVFDDNSRRVQIAFDYIKLESDERKYAALKVKYDKLSDEYKNIQAQRDNLTSAFSLVCNAKNSAPFQPDETLMNI